MRRRLFLIVMALLALAAGYWRWGMQPAHGLARGDATEVVLATNQLQESLQVIGYDLRSCRPKENLIPAYTCFLEGPEADRLRTAVRNNGSSYSLMPWDSPMADPVHVVSFRLTTGDVYVLAIRSLEEADQGVFFGYRSGANSVRWFRYFNPGLGRALSRMRR